MPKTELSPEFVALLHCPQTHQPLALADPALLVDVKDCAGQPIEAALLRRDGAVLYPIRDGIPVLLAEEAITRPHRSPSPQDPN